MPTLKQWWTPEVDSAWRNKRTALKHWRAAKTSSDVITRETARSARNKADAVWKRITLSSERRYWDIFLQERYRDSGQFWRFIGSIGDSKPQTSSMQMVADSRILRTDEEGVRLSAAFRRSMLPWRHGQERRSYQRSFLQATATRLT